MSRLIGSCCIIELHKYFLKRENLPDDGKRKKPSYSRPINTPILSFGGFEKFRAAVSFCLK